MKKAIKILRESGVFCDSKGNILNELPLGIEGISLVESLEDITYKNDYCYTIINNKIERIEQ